MSFTFSPARRLSPEEVSPLGNLLQNSIANYMALNQAQYQKPMLEEALQKSKLFNQYYGKTKEAELAMNDLRANALRQLMGQRHRKEALFNANPFLGSGGDLGKIGALMYLKQHPENMNQLLPERNPMPQEGSENSYIANLIPEQRPSYNQHLQELIEQSLHPRTTRGAFNPTGYAKALSDAQAIKESLGENSAEYKNAIDYANNIVHGKPAAINSALENHRNAQLNRKHWDSLPVDAKQQLIAVGQGAGIRPDELEREITTGKSVDDILYERGYDKDNQPEPVYLLTGKNRSDLNQREVASREVKYLSDFITDATGNYANKIKGYNINQVKDALQGKNKHQQARFLAARGLSPELINLRLQLAGAKSTVHAQQAMAEKSMLNNKIFEPLVSSDVWAESQKIMDKELQKAFKVAKKGYGQPAIKDKKIKDLSTLSDEELKQIAGIK